VSGPDGTPAGLRHVYSGKVRELYHTADDLLLLVATDRISAFDHVLEPPIPGKGKILTQLSLWWFEQLADIVPSHLADPVASHAIPAEFAGRAMACLPLRMIQAECVARGYLAGSGLADYRATGSVCGVPLPPGLTEGSRLPEPVFTPATKAPRGEHDQNIPAAELAGLVGAGTAAELERITLAVYRRGAELAEQRGILLADTKLEFGFGADGVLRLADEVLTPDSSRFWPADRWQPGRSQPSFDKQVVRDWLLSPASGWERAGGQPPPALPDAVVRRTRAAYAEAYCRITGQPWDSVETTGDR
jgi:phosphoribosylaminoimidazole-succinocarboxamide synthase